MPDEPMTLPPAPSERDVPRRPYVPEGRRGRGAAFWMAILMFFLLLGSAGLNFFLLVLLVSGPLSIDPPKGPKPLKEVTQEGSGDQKLLVLPIEGVISEKEGFSILGRSEDLPEKVKGHLRQAAKDRSVRAVILRVNSPGGGVTASDTISRHIARFKAERPDVQIVAYFDDLAASGGYYVACGAHHIVAHPTNLSGSIGVLMTSFNAAELLKKVGIEPRVLTSGKYKDILSTYRPMTPDEEQLLRGIVNEMYERFVDVVAAGRKKLTRDQVKKLADGRVYTASQALKAGLVDELGTFEDAVAATRKLAGLTGSARLITYQKPAGLLELLEGAGVRGPARGELRLSLDVEGLSAASRPHFLYLWDGRLR